MKSAYLLELSVAPGGARRGDVMMFSTFAHLRILLEWELFSEDRAALAADHAVFLGQTMVVWIVEHGVATTHVDLRPFIRASADGSDLIRLDDRDAIDALRKRREDPFVDEATFEVDWVGLERAIPPLTGDLVGRGDELEVSVDATGVETYLSSSTELAWGWNDLENGYDADETFPELK